MRENNLIVRQVINLFKKHPSFRDDRYGTIEYICLKFYREHYGHSIYSDFKLLSDIDRAFRMVQQEIPELRGADWLLRQRNGGEISQEEYENQKMKSEIKESVEQLKLL